MKETKYWNSVSCNRGVEDEDVESQDVESSVCEGFPYVTPGLEPQSGTNIGVKVVNGGHTGTRHYLNEVRDKRLDV